MKKFKISNMIKTVIASVSVLAATATMAYADKPGSETVQGVREHFVNTSSNLMMAVLLIAGIAGVAYVGMGLFSLKAASDSAGQANQNMQKGFAKIILGGLLIAIPFLTHVSTSVLQSGTQSGSGTLSIPNYGTGENGAQHTS